MKAFLSGLVAAAMVIASCGGGSQEVAVGAQQSGTQGNLDELLRGDCPEAEEATDPRTILEPVEIDPGSYLAQRWIEVDPRTITYRSEEASNGVAGMVTAPELGDRPLALASRSLDRFPVFFNHLAAGEIDLESRVFVRHLPDDRSVAQSILVALGDDAAFVDSCLYGKSAAFREYANSTERTLGELAVLLGTNDPALHAELGVGDSLPEPPTVVPWSERPLTQRDLLSTDVDGPPAEIRDRLITQVVIVDNVPEELRTATDPPGFCLLSTEGWTGCANFSLADRSGSFTANLMALPGSRLEGVIYGGAADALDRSGLFVRGPSSTDNNSVVHVTLDEKGEIASIERVTLADAERLSPAIEFPPEGPS